MPADDLLLDAIDVDEAIALASSLVRIPSHPGVESQESDVVRALDAFLRDRELSTEMVEVAPGRPNLYCTVSGEGEGPHLVLCGHTDTVPPNAGDQGVGLSGEIRDGRLLGRGSADMKGAIAAMCAALVGLHRTRDRSLPRGSVSLAAVVDEEMESLGAEHFVKSGGHADGAIVGEPTENRLALAHKGLEWIEIELEGRAAHGGRPEQGVNAIAAAARFIERCRVELLPRFADRTHERLGPPTLNFGTIAGGDQPSTVAGRCLVRVDRRTVPAESWESVSAELLAVGAEVESEVPGVRVRVRRMEEGMASLEHVALVTSEDDPVVLAAASALRASGLDPAPTVFPAWSDAALLSRFAGIPSIVLGPGDLALAHTPNELVPLSELADASRVYALAAARFCGGADENEP